MPAWTLSFLPIHSCSQIHPLEAGQPQATCPMPQPQPPLAWRTAGACSPASWAPAMPPPPSRQNCPWSPERSLPQGLHLTQIKAGSFGSSRGHSLSTSSLPHSLTALHACWPWASCQPWTTSPRPALLPPEGGSVQAGRAAPPQLLHSLLWRLCGILEPQGPSSPPWHFLRGFCLPGHSRTALSAPSQPGRGCDPRLPLCHSGHTGLHGSPWTPSPQGSALLGSVSCCADPSGPQAKSPEVTGTGRLRCKCPVFPGESG